MIPVLEDHVPPAIILMATIKKSLAVPIDNNSTGQLKLWQ